LQVLPSVLATEWDSPTFTPYREAFPPEYRTTPSAFSSHVQDLTARDIKAPYLKSLQGYLWTRGYASGELTCPLFPDVAPRLKTWASSSPLVTLIIYSSGSIAAQKLLFQHTDSGDLTPLLTDYFDTTNAGPKTEYASYVRIWGTHSGRGKREEWLFLSDNVQEVRAARGAGMKALLVVREGNGPVEEWERKELGAVGSFEEVRVGGSGAVAAGKSVHESEG